MDVVEKIKEFINKEADARVLKQKELMGLPLKTRVAKGDAISNLEEVDLYSVIKKGTNEYHHKVLAWNTNNSKFKAGDYVKIHKGELNDENNVYEGSIVFEGPNFFVIERGFAGKSFKKENGVIWTMEKDNPDLRHFFIDAMDSLPYNKQKNKIVEIIKGNIAPEYDIKEIKKAINLSNVSFNRMQKKAFISAYAAKNYSLIQGPPGTGKTWVLAHIALAFAKIGQKVLITSLTHKAVNNALLKIREVSDFQNIMKIGQSFHQDNLEEKDIKCFESFDESQSNRSEEEGIIIGGSTYALYTRRLKSLKFDTIIFDEASQMTISHTVAAMLKGEKYIFIGDHKQMPPIFNAKHTLKLLSKSLFENLIEKKEHSTMLDITYRMNNKLNSFPSEAFYNGLLKTNSSNATKYFKIKNKIPDDINQILDPNKPNVTLKINHHDNKMQSNEEAYIITILIISLLNVGVEAKNIAVLVPYRAQARLIKQYLHNEHLKNYSVQISELIVDTVERMQGQERDIIFISMAASDHQFINENVEFLFNPNRFNVSITRAKYKRIFICSYNLLDAKSDNYQVDIDRFNQLFKQSHSLKMEIQK